MQQNHSTCVSLMLLVLAAFAKAEDVLVTVEQGTLRGKTATGVYNTSYTAFLGIPYAAPPLGELRFKAPRPAPGWEGVLDATQYGSDCVQSDGSGSEDCLFLNVFVPGVPQQGAGLPVLFWVHGGGFTDGSGSDYDYGPDFLVSYNVILVTINYRLGALGFLSTGDEVAPGNAGLKDQQLALSWLQRNIASFGGDPQRVMLFGESAGGRSVSLHLMSPGSAAAPLVAGLFSRLVIQSGTFIARMAVVQDPRFHAFRLGAILGYETEDSQQLVEFLRSVNATDLLVDDALLMSEEQLHMLRYKVWAPTIEPDLDGAFIAESPIRALNEGRFHQVPIMNGVLSGEYGFQILNNRDEINTLNEAFEDAVGPSLHLPTIEEQSDAAQKLRNFYFGDANITADNPAPLVYLNVDIIYFEPGDALVRTVTNITDLPVYYYEFDYRGENVDQTEWGVTHAGELQFLFVRNHADIHYNLDPDSEEDHVRRNMLRLWTNFGKYGNPTLEPDPVVWQPYDLSSRSYLLMQANFSLQHNKDGERMDFWNQNVPLLPYPGT